MQIPLNRRQRHAHHGDIQQQHERRRAHQHQRPPLPRRDGPFRRWCCAAEAGPIPPRLAVESTMSARVSPFHDPSSFIVDTKPARLVCASHGEAPFRITASQSRSRVGSGRPAAHRPPASTATATAARIAATRRRDPGTGHRNGPKARDETRVLSRARRALGRSSLSADGSPRRNGAELRLHLAARHSPISSTSHQQRWSTSEEDR